MKLWRYGRPIEILGERYRLDGMLGSGGMAEVVSAWDEYKRRQVAIKILRTEELDQRMLNRFVKESALVAGWQHPHILQVYDQLQIELLDTADKDAVLHYIVMEFAAGGDLQKRLTSGEPYYSLSAAFTIFRQICGAVQYAHKHGVIHRDLKPLNILFRQPRTGPEEAVLSDFGLAVQVDASHHTFAHAGTLAYMAPEQIRGQAQPASDIFALGVTLYQLCTGYLPFHREMSALPHILAGNEPEPIPPSQLNPDFPSDLDEVVLQALHPDPAGRPRSAAAFWNELVAVLAEITLPSETRATGQVTTPELSQPLSLLTAHVDAEEENNGGRAGEGTDTDSQATYAAPIQIPKPIVLQQEQFAAPPRPLPRQSGERLAPVQRRVPPQQRRPRRLLVPLLVIAGVLVLLTTFLTISPMLFASSTTVTIIPHSHPEQKSYTFSADQVHAHQLSVTATPKTNTGNVSGTIPGKKARGQLTFINNGSTDVTVPTKTFIGNDGVVVTFQGPVDVTAIPASVTVDATAVTVGAAGNIPAFDILQYCCAAGKQIQVRNATAFTGGTDAVPNDKVQQSDIDQAAQALINTQTQQEQNKLKAQVQGNERVIGSSQCQPTVTPNNPVGTQAKTVTVTVSVTCTEEVYDSQVVQTLATGQLTSQATKDLGTSYRLTGQVAASVQSMSTNSVQVQAQGLWVYNFTSASLSRFKALIANKSPAAARTLLLSQPGIADVQISTTGTLPSADHLQIKVQTPVSS